MALAPWIRSAGRTPRRGRILGDRRLSRPIDLDLALPAIAARLGARAHQRFGGEARRWAAVAAVLRRGPLDTELLLIRRAERDGDPWSGHMALPGGHRQPEDSDLLATALR